MNPNKQIGIPTKPRKDLLEMYGEPKKNKDRAAMEAAIAEGSKASKKDGKGRKKSVSAQRCQIATYADVSRRVWYHDRCDCGTTLVHNNLTTLNNSTRNLRDCVLTRMNWATLASNGGI